MKILLFGNTVIKENLSYKQACAALKAANETTLANRYKFYIQARPGEDWTLYATDREIEQQFINAPERFLIEIPS